MSALSTHRHNQPLGVGNGCVQNESSSKEWTTVYYINLGLCNLPTFKLPGKNQT